MTEIDGRDYTESELDEYLTYLDDLRTSGKTNMFGATSYLMSEFGIDKREARAILSYMKTFESRHKTG